MTKDTGERGGVTMHVARVAAWVFMFSSLACKGDNPSGASGNQPPWIPDFTRLWYDLDDPSIGYQFQAGADTGRPVGRLTGTETRGGVIYNLRGVFNQKQVEFTVERSGGVDFVGVLADPDTMRVTSSREGPRTIVR